MVLLLMAWGPLSLMASSIGIVLLDIGAQALHVSSQSMILRSGPEPHSRLIVLYMLI